MSNPFAFQSLPRGLPHGRPVSKEDRPSRGVWLDPDALHADPKWTDAASSLVLGRDQQGRLLCLDDNRHCLTVAGSRAGKGVSVILPNLARYSGSVCVLDPKGENANLTAERRGKGRGVPAGGMGQEVFVIDPFEWAEEVPPEYRAGFNPIADLDPRSKLFVDECYSLADALVMATAKDANDHWNSTARLVLRGFIAWVASASEGRRDLVEVRRLLHLPRDDFDDLIDAFIDAPDRANGVPAEMAGALQGMGDDERGSVLSTVRQNILFLSSEPMADCLSDTTRQPDLKAWKMGGQSIYLVLPASLMGQHARFFRLFLNRLIAASETDDKPKVSGLLLLDEMHVLGHMAQLETAAGLMAGYGLKIWSIWQDFTQAEAIFGERWQTFLGNASVFQSFGLNDMKTLQYVSDRLGPTSVLTSSAPDYVSVGQKVRGNDGVTRSLTSNPLLSPDEVAFHFSRQAGAQAVIYPGAPPIWMWRASWLDKDFRKYWRNHA